MKEVTWSEDQTAKLVELKGLWYLHIPITKEVEDFQKENLRHVVGIDRGLRFLTVSYDEKGKTSFVSGRKIAIDALQLDDILPNRAVEEVEREKLDRWFERVKEGRA